MNLQISRIPAFVGALLTLSSLLSGAEPRSEAWLKPDPAAVKRWQAMRFGIFIHWGPVSLTHREISWSRGTQTPIAEYDNLYKRFNPVKFQADQWAAIAKAAGAKYVVLTTKHHDGFCLFATRQTDYNIMHSPFGRDVAKELADACRKQGIAFGAYYSVCDWHHPDFPLTGPGGSIRRAKSDLDAYNRYLLAQTRELIAHCGPLVTIWNDVPQMFEHRGVNTIKMARQLQPDILINDRTGDGGDYSTPEQQIGGFNMDRPWESCMTISAHNQWSWGGPADGVKSLAECLLMLVRASGGDGNVLLNVGPTPEGEIEPCQVNRLKEIGAWLAKYGESIYGARGGPYKPTRYMASTRKGNTVYVHITAWPEETLLLPRLPAKIVASRAVTGGQASVRQGDDGVEIAVPKADRQEIDTIVALELDKPAMDIQPIAVHAVGASLTTAKPAKASTVYRNDNNFKPSWESLKAHRDPEWFRDAKFGIYTHWGPVTIGSEDCPCGGQWYGHEMYDPKSGVFAWHKQHFGEQGKVGYKDLIPMFKAEKFDAEAWADLFARSGARFAGPVAVHHDNFAMWDSAVTPWNAVKMGPHRDVVGELEKAIKRRGLKFITTFHHGYAWRYFEPAFAFDGAAPRYALLYTEAHKPDAPPSKAFLEKWLAMVDEAVAKYQPDMIWFDFELMAVITPQYQQRMFADYYNWAARNHRESAVAHKFREIHQYTGILDFERGREDRLAPYPWLTDTALAEWFNNKPAPYRSLDNLVQVLVDIVSKNGCMLLDVSPAADGTIPDQARRMLLGMGDWLALNGEAIYGTRPWLVYGEGPTKGKRGGFSEGTDKPFTANDIRFTTKGAALYAIALGWPKDGKLLIKSLASDAGRVSAVSMLGHAGPLAWTQGTHGLEIALPAKKPCGHAYVLKIAGHNLQPANRDRLSTVETHM